MSSTHKVNAHHAPEQVPPMADSTTKGVTIFDEPERLEFVAGSPALLAQSPRLRRASISGKKMVGRPALHHNPSTTSLSGHMASFKLDQADQSDGQTLDGNETPSLAHQVMQWLQDERGKRARSSAAPGEQKSKEQLAIDHEKPITARASEEQDLALDKLERILAKYAASAFSTKSLRRQSSSYFRRGSVAKKYLPSSTATSDTDGGDNIATVPHVEASLDNSKTLAYTVGGPADIDTSESANQKGHKHWESFKQDAIRILHTLNLRGWRRLPIDLAKHVYVERLSGALTNAVYVVKPPKDIEMFNYLDESGEVIKQKRLPKPLLLRIYGPQTENLIDRESELMILRRLAAKNIGPRLLGYFTNGRFEEFLHAKTLTPQDLRDSSTSKQIAKRMKELHEGIELLQSERAAGPYVFLSWDKWVDRVEKVITWLDRQVHDVACHKATPDERYTRRGLICGVEWPKFRKAYEDYRRKLIEEYGGSSKIRQDLVFAHNDTQYGNLLRLVPDDKSPLLQPVNHHKQLVVIDFEYSNANTIGQEFANHFTEWCYNYHHHEHSWACNTSTYPTPEEQYRFVRAYVMHRPQFVASASSTPLMEPREKTNIPDFMLDARAPGGGYGWDYDHEEKAREQEQEHDIQKLLHQTRLWRIANSAFWVAWGIIQAKIPELEDTRKRDLVHNVLEKVKSKLHPQSDPLDEEVKEIQEESKHDRPEGRLQEEAHHEGDENGGDDGGFDYLAYAQDRAMFFWGDCIQMGIVKEGDLPKEILPHIKYVKY